MRSWWQRRSLKLRLAVWFTAAASGVLLGLTPVVYWLIEHRLRVELDRQLEIDWSLVEAHLELDGSGRIQWRKTSPATPNSPGYAATWFDVWSVGELSLRHWPVDGGPVAEAPNATADPFHSIRLEMGGSARALEKGARVGGREVTLRVFRDESGLHRTLREIAAGFGLGIPLAALLASFGGYLVAGWTLRPISAMTEQARRITSESLGQRLPNPNPHDELGQLATVFNQTLERLENSFESLRRFTADASHELRTPLTALRAIGEVALRNPSDAAALRETLGSMLEEAQRLSDLTDALLLLARFESGRWTLRFEAVELDGLVADVCECLGVLAADRHQTLEINAPMGLVVRADRVPLRQAVMNVLHNAIRHSPPGTRVTIRCFPRGRLAVIEIGDEGPGIAPEHRDRIFDRFYRVDPSRSRQDGGAGLGLAIAKLSIEQLGGGIELESELGKGSRFRISMPAESTQ
ncbi:MAG: HAMP domain-containing protein [Verrucomicrobiaceae bacterium]|nr:HAMP domain-containing protein [Verrucomicrobiaceae bacterium]